jgi:hypothetical protein
MCRLFAVVSVALAILSPTARSAQEAPQVALGVVQDDGWAYLSYEGFDEGWRVAQWRSEGWRPSDDELWVGATVTFQIPPGPVEQGVLGGGAYPWETGGVAYRLPEADADRDAFPRRPAPGYFTTMSEGHTSFDPIESHLTDDEWSALADEELGMPPDSVPQRIRPSVWQATLPGRTVTFFKLTRQAEVSGCPPLHQLGGVLGEDFDPVVVVRSGGDCEGKGWIDRTPVALVHWAEEFYVLVRTADWELEGGELWRVVEDGLVPLHGND